MNNYTDIELSRDGQVATIRILPTGAEFRERMKMSGARFPKIHSDIGNALLELRGDNSVRVIILTGTGDSFLLPPPLSPTWEWQGDPGVGWDLTLGLTRTLEAFIETEKPIIAKVNGNAISFGSSIAFASDFIVAREDAIFGDHHLAMGEILDYRKDFGTVPGDGGAVFVPLYMSPTLAKEYLLLAKTMTGAELARMGIINYAVPADKLDETVNQLAQRLLKRSPYALAWGKRIINRRVSQNMNLTHDSAWLSELLNFYMAQPSSREKGGDRGVTTL